MATLEKVTEVSRRILIIGFLSIIGIFILVTLINIIKGLNPPPPPPPTVAFGKLPTISFGQNVTSEKLAFNIDTLSGNLPDFGDRASVYKVQQVEPTLLALDNAKSLVFKLGYINDPVRISDTEYQWTNTDDLQKRLLFNIFTNEFSITSPYTSYKDVIQGNNLPDQNGAIQVVMSYLQNGALLPTDIDTSKTKATLFGITNGKLVPATSLSSAQVVEVDLFQNDIDNLPIFYPQPTRSTMNLLVGGGTNTSQVIQATFIHQSISSGKATYPIVTSQQAFDLLKKGQGFIASYDGTGTNISIKSVVLGFYMSNKTQQYLEPIIVFQGDHGFFAYVPAIKDEWISN